MPSAQWSYDATTSRSLRLLSHLPVAAFGGVFLLAAGAGAAFVIADPGALYSPFTVLFVLLFLVGGPASLLYLWPMLADADQRPTQSAFSGTDGSPFTARSAGLAAVAGVLAVLTLAAFAPPGTLYAFLVGSVFSPVFVAVATTEGELDDGRLTIDRREVPLRRVTGVRSARVGGLVVLWVSYVRRSGLFVPRLAVVPADDADAVVGALEAGIRADPGTEPPDRAVQAVAVGAGALFLAFGAFAYLAVGEPAVRLYVAAVSGGLGAFLCLVGLRGV